MFVRADKRAELTVLLSHIFIHLVEKHGIYKKEKIMAYKFIIDIRFLSSRLIKCSWTRQDRAVRDRHTWAVRLIEFES